MPDELNDVAACPERCAMTQCTTTAETVRLRLLQLALACLPLVNPTDHVTLRRPSRPLLRRKMDNRMDKSSEWSIGYYL